MTNFRFAWVLHHKLLEDSFIRVNDKKTKDIEHDLKWFYGVNEKTKSSTNFDYPYYWAEELILEKE